MTTTVVTNSLQGPSGPAGTSPFKDSADFGVSVASPDNQAAILAAAESLRTDANTTPGTIMLPRGTLLTGPLDFSTHRGLRLVGQGAPCLGASISGTVLKAKGSQSYVIKNTSVGFGADDIEFHGANTTTRAVMILEYFSHMSQFNRCGFTHTKFDNAVYTNGAALLEMGGVANLQVDDSLFSGCVFNQDPDNAANYCRYCILVNQNNAYLLRFADCFISGGHDNVYSTGGGVKLVDCDLENAVRAHCVRDYSNVVAGVNQQSPTWIVRCFTETAVPFVLDINASTPNPASYQGFGELHLTDNFSSTTAGADIALLADTHISGGVYGNINIQASAANGGAGYAYVSAHHVSFRGGCTFTGSGVSNLAEFGSSMDNFPSLSKTPRSAMLGQTTAERLFLTNLSGTTIRFQENVSPAILADAVSSNRPPADFSWTTQAPFASATGASRKPGDWVLNIPTEVSGGNVGRVRVNCGSVNNAFGLDSGGLALGVSLGTGLNTVGVGGGVDVTLTSTQYNTGSIKLTGVITANINVILPWVTGWQKTILNATTGAFTLTVKHTSGTGIVVGSGKTAVLMFDGTNVVRVTADV